MKKRKHRSEERKQRNGKSEAEDTSEESQDENENQQERKQPPNKTQSDAEKEHKNDLYGELLAQCDREQEGKIAEMSLKARLDLYDDDLVELVRIYIKNLFPEHEFWDFIRRMEIEVIRDFYRCHMAKCLNDPNNQNKFKSEGDAIVHYREEHGINIPQDEDENILQDLQHATQSIFLGKKVLEIMAGRQMNNQHKLGIISEMDKHQLWISTQAPWKDACSLGKLLYLQHPIVRHENSIGEIVIFEIKYNYTGVPDVLNLLPEIVLELPVGPNDDNPPKPKTNPPSYEYYRQYIERREKNSVEQELRKLQKILKDRKAEELKKILKDQLEKEKRDKETEEIKVKKEGEQKQEMIAETEEKEEVAETEEKGESEGQEAEEKESCSSSDQPHATSSNRPRGSTSTTSCSSSVRVINNPNFRMRDRPAFTSSSSRAASSTSTSSSCSPGPSSLTDADVSIIGKKKGLANELSQNAGITLQTRTPTDKRSKPNIRC